MVAASIWSLLIPAIEQSEGMASCPSSRPLSASGSACCFLLLLDRLIPHLHVGSDQAEGPKSRLGRTTMMVLAVTLHNNSGGNGGGRDVRGLSRGERAESRRQARLSVPWHRHSEFSRGSVSSPCRYRRSRSKGKAFPAACSPAWWSPIGAVLTILAAQLVIPALPYHLSLPRRHALTLWWRS